MSDQTATKPGRLGTPDLTLGTDPRADARLVAMLEPLGLAAESEDPPVEPDGPMEAIHALVAAAEPGYAALFDMVFGDLPAPDNVEATTQTITGRDGNEITLFIHRPTDVEGPVPGIVHTHGGGMVLMKAADLNYQYWRNRLASLGMVVVGVEFRNGSGALGNHPFPAGLNDCISGAQWVSENREELGISALIISGESGGGNLSLATTLSAKQEGWLDSIAGVYAQCPYISGAYDGSAPELGSLLENENYFLNGKFMECMVRAYDPDGENTTNPLAWPWHAAPEDLDGLPPHVISVNELDPLRDEGLAYYDKLAAAGVDVNKRVVAGTCHAGDCLAPTDLADVFDGTLADIHRFAQQMAGTIDLTSG